MYGLSTLLKPLSRTIAYKKPLGVRSLRFSTHEPFGSTRTDYENPQELIDLMEEIIWAPAVYRDIYKTSNSPFNSQQYEFKEPHEISGILFEKLFHRLCKIQGHARTLQNDPIRFKNHTAFQYPPMTIAALFGGSAGSRLARWLTMYGADVNAQLIAPYRLREVDLKTSMKYTSCGTALRIALQNKDQGLAETLLDLGINLKLTFGTGPKEEAAYSSKILTLCHGSKSLERIVFAAFKKEQEADKEKQKTADEALGKKLREVIKSGGSPATLIRDLKEQKSATKTKKTQENISAPKQF